MKSEFALQPVGSDEEWDAFVQASPHGSVYALSACVRALHVEPARYYCCRGSTKVAGVLLSQRAPETVRDAEVMIYTGILGGAPQGQQGNAALAFDHFQATEFLVEELAARHHCIDMQLSPEFVDIRPFLWYNYGTTRPKFRVDVRYTSYLDITNLADDEAAARARARRLRRRDLHEAEESGVTTREEFDPALCTELYRQTLARQQIPVPVPILDEMQDVMRSLDAAGLGRMFIARGPSGAEASALFVGIDAKRAYCMFAGSDPSTRDESSGTAVHWAAFRALSQSGVTQVDLEGINSPNRGRFKLSFGGTVVPYFGLSLDQRDSQ